MNKLLGLNIASTLAYRARLLGQGRLVVRRYRVALRWFRHGCYTMATHEGGDVDAQSMLPQRPGLIPQPGGARQCASRHARAPGQSRLRVPTASSARP